MFNVRHIALAAAFVGATSLAAIPASAQTEDCDTMIGQINQLLETADLTEAEKEQVMELRDEGMAQNTRAGGDCTTTLQQALDILQQ